MKGFLTGAPLVKLAWRDFRQAWRGLVFFEIVFKLVEAWLLVPTIAMVLAGILARTGRNALSNLDIVDFFLTPFGVLYGAVFGIVAVALLLIEQAGIMVIVTETGSTDRPSLKQALVAGFGKAWRVVQLGALKATLLALTFVPFVILGVLTYALLLAEYDIYFYLKDRPPVFWAAAGIGALLLLTASVAGILLYVRWAFALPILLFESQFATAALRTSHERIRGIAWHAGFLLLGWQVAALVLGVALLACFRLFAGTVLANAGDRPVVPILLLLVSQGGLVAILSFVRVVGQGVITRRLYLHRSAELGILCGNELASAALVERPMSPWPRRLALLALVLVMLAPLALWAELSRYKAASPLVQVTAHRGHARAAPENTLSAIRKAIDSGADYAEIDVQQTADGVIVLLHDRDLKRVAGDSRRLADLTYDEVRKLDVGSWFSPAFADERVPTLAEVIDLSRGRIKLHIELKFFGPDQQLAPAVARLVHEHQFESKSLIASMHYNALLEARRQNPGLRTALTVAHALGDINQFEVDALSVRADFLSEDVLRAAQRRGREVHVWTVNDPRQMIRQIKRGVDNILTSDPDLLVRVREEWANQSDGDRLLQAGRLLLGLPL